MKYLEFIVAENQQLAPWDNETARKGMPSGLFTQKGQHKAEVRFSAARAWDWSDNGERRGPVRCRNPMGYRHEFEVDREAAGVFEGITNEITNGANSTNEKGATVFQ